MQGLDFVITEARRHGIYLLLCLTNNFDDFGGKRQYVQWAREDVAAGAGGHNLTSADDFFNNTLVKSYYKNHVKVVINSFITSRAIYIRVSEYVVTKICFPFILLCCC